MTVFAAADRARFRALYPARAGRFRHGLVGHELLTLESLVGLASRLGGENVEYNHGDLPVGIDPGDVPRNGLTPEETIRRIEECGSWMVLKFVERDPAYKALLDRALGALAEAIEPVTGEILTPAGFIFISSPVAVTPFHMDPEHNILLQIRGAKRMTVFPGDEEMVPAERHEAYHVGGHRNLPWRESFAARGEAFELAPGDALHVPVKHPHWVKNGAEPSISFSITWRSQWSYEEADIRGMNHMLRRLGLSPRPPAPFPKRNPAKALAWRALRKARQGIGR
jgi:mannose-6-phosphate isomerase-like protein (cupin superfamily)